jgi:hypothetical protein
MPHVLAGQDGVACQELEFAAAAAGPTNFLSPKGSIGYTGL